MKAFTDTVHTKETALGLALWHKEQDNYIQGTYEKGTKGCSVGCMVMAYKKEHSGVDWHAATETLYGIPHELSYMQDLIFEGLSVEESKEWTPKFFAAINVGADLSMVVSKTVHWLLTDPDGLRKRAKADGLKAIDRVAELYAQRLNGVEPQRSEWLSAREEALTARRNADAAAYAYAAYAYAAYAYAAYAYAAYAYAYADAYAYAAAYAYAYAYARKKFWKKLSEKVISILEETK